MIFGFLAGIIIIIATIPQIVCSLKSNNIKGLNLLYIILMNLGLLLWILHGIIINDFDVIIFNSIGLLEWILLLVIKLKNMQ